MNLQLLSTVGGAVLTLINLIGVLIQNRMRADISELKVQLAENRAKDREELRTWIDEEFMRRDAIEARLDALKARIAAGQN